jgi:glycosidase
MNTAFAADAWMNDLRSLFLGNSAVIYEVNIRTFNAQDLNGNGIIDNNEESGNFINAVARLDELASQGVNTIHVMPVTPVGKTKALGTAGSLYAAAGFNSLNPQLQSSKSSLSLDEQAEKFVSEAHRRKIRVIFDLPQCGSYDLYMQRPELFVKDASGQPVVPSDWTDVRLLNAGTETAINRDVLNLYKEFVDMAMRFGADGIRADGAAGKPAAFWKELITYTRRQDPQFLWLAEASEYWTKPVSEYAVFTPYDKLLGAGFDGYYGSYFNLKDWKTGKEFIDQISATRSVLKKYSEPKAVIGSFVTHDELSPILVNGQAFSEMIIWLNAALPVNSYFPDGFSTGDNYLYLWANKKAKKTCTDDEYYFAHRGKIDIFNFSRKPGGKNTALSKEFPLANVFKRNIAPLLTEGNFIPLKASAPSVFAYAVSDKGQSLIVMGNLNFRTGASATVTVPKLTENNLIVPIKLTTTPVPEKGRFKVDMAPGEIQVLMLPDVEVK